MRGGGCKGEKTEGGEDINSRGMKVAGRVARWAGGGCTEDNEEWATVLVRRLQLKRWQRRY